MADLPTILERQHLEREEARQAAGVAMLQLATFLRESVPAALQHRVLDMVATNIAKALSDAQKKVDHAPNKP